MTVYEWKPLQFLQKELDGRFVLMVLNQPNPLNESLVDILWKKASYKITIDGGTNLLYNTFVGERESYLPDIITGDFDSIRPEVKQFYIEKGVEVIETPDQDYTDFTKALKTASEKIKGKEITDIIVLASFGGRFDHVWANFNSLYEVGGFCDAKVILFSKDTVAFLLAPGCNKIHVDASSCGEWCGLIPVGEPCNSVTTQGLKWNVDKQKLKFGELISTSNTLENETTSLVTIQTDNPLLWMMGINLENAGLQGKGCTVDLNA